MDVGIMVEGQQGLTWERWRHIVHRVEELGFDSLWRSDHFFSFGDDRSIPSLEAMVSLAVAASESWRITFGPLVCSMTFRHPSLLARMAAHLDQLSGGRLVLGVGAGWNVPEHEAYGIPFPPVATRMDMLEEGVQVLRALWAGGPTSFSGKHFQLRDAYCEPRPGRPTRLLIGGAGEKRTLRIAAQHADEWNCVALTPEQFAAKREVLLAHCRDVGRDASTIRCSLMTWALVGETEEEIDELARRATENFATLAGMTPAKVRHVMGSRGWPVGRPEQLVQHLRALAAAGVSRVMLQHVDYNNDRFLEMLARHVVPAVRDF